jgi:hypothetical protein
MRTKFTQSVLFLGIILIASCSRPQKSEIPCTPVSEVKDFIGQWTIDIQDGWVGWLEVRQEDGYLDADLLWKWGSVAPVASVIHSPNKGLIVTRVSDVERKKDANGAIIRSHTYTSSLGVSKLSADKITGFMLEPKTDGTGYDSTSFTGTKLPDVPAAPDLLKVKFDQPIELFNGKDLSGWKLIDEKQVNGFSVVDGTLTNNPVQKEGESHISYGNLRTEKVFEDFNLKLEVNVPAGSNSGIYLRGIYEVQVIDSYGKALDSHHMGGLYSRIAPSVNAEEPAGQWQAVDITLCERHVTVLLNGTKIIDNKPVYGPTGGAMSSDVFAAGPIYLQGDHGSIAYRNMVLTPILK